VKLVAVVAVSLIVVSVAAAAQGDPKKVIIRSVQAKAKAINVRLTDLGAGEWTAKPSTPKSSTPRCSYYNPNQSDLTENGDADSPSFTLPSSSYIASTTGIFKTAAPGRTAYKRIVQPALPKCLAELLQKGVGSKLTVVSSNPISFPKLGERTNAYRVLADYSISTSVVLHFSIDVVAMNRGKVDVALFFFYAGNGPAFTSAYEVGVARKVAARMATVK
jgi:hypothetical protein